MTGRFYFVSVPAPSSLHSRRHSSAPASPSSAFVPFDWWESKLGILKHHCNGLRGEDDEYEDDAFDFERQVVADGSNAVTADELFEAGKIGLLKLPPRLQQVSSNLSYGDHSPFASPRSTTAASLIARLFRRGRKEEEPFDPFEKAIEQTTRGREREMWLRGSFRRCQTARTRSASPLRTVLADSSSDTDTPTGGSVRTGRKWRRLKDLLLVRSKWRMKDLVLSPEPQARSGERRTEDGEVSASTATYMLKSAMSETMKKTLSYKKRLLEHRRILPSVQGLVKGFVHGRS